MNHLIPLPVSVEPLDETFTLTAVTPIIVEPATAEVVAIPEVMAIGRYLADQLRSATGYELAVVEATAVDGGGHIELTVDGRFDLADEGYELTVTAGKVSLRAAQPAGLFYGVQTLRQLLPTAVNAATLQPGPWTVAGGVIRDQPRFGWRGLMLDVARHFFGVDQVKRIIDLMAAYKLNRLHLHLTDDQGWRLMIHAWPKLAEYGGTTQVGGGRGGYYTQAEYADIVAYAQSRYITIIPEIDLPGHTNAALAAYPELNCNDEAPPLYTGVAVGFSSLCIHKEITYTFLEDVIREVAALTPGPYIHIGGDEAHATPAADYLYFIERIQSLVLAQGKQVIGWEEIGRARLLPGVIVQHWNSLQGDPVLAATAVSQGAKVIMSPASKVYLDMKYDPDSPLGISWAGHTDVPTAYNWDPATQVNGISENDLLGVEAALWTETVETTADIEWLLFPRLPGIAEVAWSPAAARNWPDYHSRLAAHAARLVALGINFYRAPAVAWDV
jgi:N-acetyl-beta-hexosaminidase